MDEDAPEGGAEEDDMAGYDPERESIFSRPDDDADPLTDLPADQPAVQASARTRRTRPAVSRQTVTIGAMALALLAVVGFVWASAFRTDDRSLAGASLTALPTASARPIASASEPLVTASATPTNPGTPQPTIAPTAAPIVATLDRGSWAIVTSDAVNVRAAAGLAAPLVGQVGRGEVVAVLGDDPVEVDAHRWYRVRTQETEGWAAAGTGASTFLDQPEAASGRWCGMVDAKVMQLGPMGTVEPVGAISVGGVALDTDLMTAAELGAAEVAWVGRTDVCADLTIAHGTVVASELTVPMATCGRPASAGYPGWILEAGDISVSPLGESGRRDVWLNEALLGFEGGAQFPEMPPLGQLLSVTTGFADVCLGGTVSGTSNGLEATTEMCMFIGEIEATQFELMWADPRLEATGVFYITLPEGSSVSANVAPQTMQGIRLRAASGTGAPMHLEDAPSAC